MIEYEEIKIKTLMNNPEPNSEEQIEVGQEPQIAEDFTDKEDFLEQKIESGDKPKRSFGSLFGFKKKDENTNEDPKKSFLSKLMSSKKSAEEAGDEESDHGNAFTAIFEKKGDDKDFIGTIIESAKDQEQKAAEPEKGFGDITNQFQAEEQKEHIAEEAEKKVFKASHLAKIFAVASLLVPLISYSFYTLSLNPDNTITNFLNISTPGKVLKEKEEIAVKEKAEIDTVKKEVEKIDKQIEELQNNKVLSEILEKRIDWLRVIKEIEDIVDEVFYNRQTKMIVFSNYSGKSSKSTITVQGEIRDEGGKSMSQLALLKDTLNADPRFSGAEVRNFSKSTDKDGVTKSTFNLDFLYSPNPQPEGETKEEAPAESAEKAPLKK